MVNEGRGVERKGFAVWEKGLRGVDRQKRPSKQVLNATTSFRQN
jgi:hypothetical protein